jgi:adenine-specific DNA-methyltransferase
MDIREEKLNDNSNITANSKQLEILKKNFPQCFDKNGNFMAHKMEDIVSGNGLELSRESYSLNWLGKSYARLLANENPLTMLKEDKEHNSLEENKNSQNLLIKGDNLEVLKHLKNAYENKIKMIYIDPPYNTGDDGFVYNDDRKFTIDELSELAGVSAEEAKRILEFTEKGSNSHSAWLTFMYPRLYIARELLKDKGAIFISIDDNEVGQLKLLCNEIFGEENFVGNIAWESKTKSQNTRTSFNKLQPKVEHILCYTKKDKRRFNLIKLGKKEYPLHDEKGKFREHTLEVMNAEGIRGRESMIFPIMDITLPKGKQWKVGKETIEKFINRKDLFTKNGNVILKMRPEDETQDISQPFWGLLQKDIGTAESAKKELSRILKNKNHGFETVKPISLIQRLIFHATDENDTILDFFAGSGTTAHTVMCLNKDSGNRKFITVQIPEVIDPKNKTAFEYVKELKKIQYPDIKEKVIFQKCPPTIFDITKERILKGAQQIRVELSKDETKDINDYDLGFKIFETTPLLENPLDKMDKFDEDTPKLFDVTTLKEDDFNALLTTWKVHDGMKLTDELQEITLKEYTAYYGDKKLYFVHGGFTTKDLKEFMNKLDEDKTFEPNKLIVFGYSFDTKYQREISEALNNYSNKKSIDIDMIVRY